MNAWNEYLTKDNIAIFIQEFAPMAYKASYKILGDTNRTETVLIESFVETFHQRSKFDQESPLFIFGDILENKVKNLSAKYPIPDSIKIKSRELDEFTLSTIVGEVNKRINSISFKLMDVLVFSDPSRQKGRSTSFISKAFSSLSEAGINLILIIQMLLVILILFIATYFGAVSLFGVNDFIIDHPHREAQRNNLNIGEAIRYMPVNIVVRPQDSVESGDRIDTDNISVNDTNISGVVSEHQESSDTEDSERMESESTEPSLSATRG